MALPAANYGCVQSVISDDDDGGYDGYDGYDDDADAGRRAPSRRGRLIASRRSWASFTYNRSLPYLRHRSTRTSSFTS